MTPRAAILAGFLTGLVLEFVVPKLGACGNDRDPTTVDAFAEPTPEPTAAAVATRDDDEPDLPRGNLSAHEQRYFDAASDKYNYYEAVPPRVVREAAIRCANGFVCCLDRRDREPPDNSERGSEYNPWQNTIYLSRGNSECNAMMESRWLRGEMCNAVGWQAGGHYDHWSECA